MTMDPTRLWAKSCQYEDDIHPSMLLPQHLQDVWLAAGKILDATATDQLSALGLNSGDCEARFRRCVLLAAAVHDLGKANDHFQGMIRRKRDFHSPQGLRHEWVTLLMMEAMKTWLLPAVNGDATDFAIVEWAVAGHHPAAHHASPPKSCPPGAGAHLNIEIDHADFREAKTFLKSVFPLIGDAPAIDLPLRPLVGASNVFLEIAQWTRAAAKTWNGLQPADRRFTAAVKNCLIAADVAGSALPQEDPFNEDRWNWITQAFKAKPKPGDLQKVVDERAKTFSASEGNTDREAFQNAVANSPDSVTLVKAGCGSGKTQAAYMWAAAKHPERRLFFCYPTTGTATEGFKDYLLEADVDADLFHSRRNVDFEIILRTDRDAPDDDTVIRIASLDAWSTPIVACTVDTVLGLVQNNRRGLYSWPALAQSAFVFDEIHSYDDRLFGALLRFLRDLPGLPVLLMTASLPAPREEALSHTLGKLRTDAFRVDLKPIPGPTDLEALGRYSKGKVENNDPLPLIETTLAGGGKVLWVCNTVRRVMQSADLAKHLKPKIYHSRFKYEDRVARHVEVVGAFKPEHELSALAVCSQVAEMSLDLKGCTLLVSDEASVPAVIQRLGRLNRQAKKGNSKQGTEDDPTRPFVLIVPENDLPYTAADLDAVRAWHLKLPDDGISQRDLANAWEQTAENPPDLVPSAWLDGGPITSVLELREGSPGITIVLESDARPILAYKNRVAREMALAREQKRKPDRSVFGVREGECHPKMLTRYTLPMQPPPNRIDFDWRTAQRVNGIPICPDRYVDYSPERGAKWQGN